MRNRTVLSVAICLTLIVLGGHRSAIAQAANPFCDDFEGGVAGWTSAVNTQTLVNSPAHSESWAVRFRGASCDCDCHSAMFRTGFAADSGYYTAWVNQQHHQAGFGLFIQAQAGAQANPFFRTGYVLLMSAANSQGPTFSFQRNNAGGAGYELGHGTPTFLKNEWIQVFIRRLSGNAFVAGYVRNSVRDSILCFDPNPPISTPGAFYLWSCSDVYSTNNYFDDVCFENLQTGCPVDIGTVVGRIRANCSGQQTGVYGVRVDAYGADGFLTATAATDESGAYFIEGLKVGQSYTITLVTPLGYTAEIDEAAVEVGCGAPAVVDFNLSCVEITSNPRTIGFWKHQVGVATGGKGTSQIDAPTLCGHLDLINAHFNSNAINQVVVYQPPPSDDCASKLEVAKDLLNLRGNVGMTARAKQQLTATLLNVAAGYLSLRSIISEDGATLSQAITYADQLIDDPSGDDETAKTICDMINNGQVVPAGVIPLGTVDIAYKASRVPETFVLSQSYPNPFNAGTVIPFTLAEDSRVRIDVFDILGHAVTTLVDDVIPAGDHHVTWDGRNPAGHLVPSGMYFYRLRANGISQSRKMVLIR